MRRALLFVFAVFKLAASICDPALVALQDRDSRFPYKDLGDRCEGELKKPTSDSGTAKKSAKKDEGTGPRDGSKTAQVVAMLQRKNGATLSEIMDMGWQKHTVRGFMAGAINKAGYTVESFKPEGGERTYRINA
jgi:hypothetical protein